MSIDINVKTAKVGFFHLPKTFYVLLLIEVLERFAFYGLQSVSIIYFIQKFRMSEAISSDLYSSFSALTYVLLILGGVVGDRVLGIARTYLLGIIVFIIGYGLLSVSSSYDMLYLSMGLILVGNIFFKTNANNYIGRCFERNDPRIDSAFTYFYMSINLGSFIGIILVPIISKAISYNVGLSLCACSMLCSLVFYGLFRDRFHLIDNQIGKNKKNKLSLFIGLLIISVFFAYLMGNLLKDSELNRVILFVGSILVLGIYLIMAFRLPKYESKGMLVALILILQSIIFWCLYVQTMTAFILFAYHNINLNILGYQVPAGMTQAFNPFFIVIFSPILASIYLNLYNKKIEVSIPAKFALGICVTSLCFILLGFASSFFTNDKFQISIVWLFIAYGFYSLGELLVTALGPAMMAKLLPKRFGGFAQGIWYLASGIGMKTGGLIVAYTTSQYKSDNAIQSLVAYKHLFYSVGVATMIIGGLLFFMVKQLTKHMNEVLAHQA